MALIAATRSPVSPLAKKRFPRSKAAGMPKTGCRVSSSASKEVLVGTSIVMSRQRAGRILLSPASQTGPPCSSSSFSPRERATLLRVSATPSFSLRGRMIAVTGGSASVSLALLASGSSGKIRSS